MPRTHTFMTCLAALTIAWCSSPIGLTQDAFTLTDSEAVLSPGDAIVVVERQQGALAFVLSRDTDTAHTFQLAQDGTLTPIGTAPTGDGPLAVTGLNGDDRLVVANSLSNDLSIMDAGPTGLIQEVGRVPSGGIAPSDVAPILDDLIIVVNRGALTGEGEGAMLFRVERDGGINPISELLPTGPQPSPFTNGNDPHIVVVGERGLVAVANSSSNDVTLLHVNQGGQVKALGNHAVGGSPKALSLESDELFVATRAQVFGASQDQIEAYEINRDNTLDFVSTTAAGWFLTDLDKCGSDLCAVTWGNHLTRSLELRRYQPGRHTGLTQTAAFTLPNQASFQQLAVLAKSAVAVITQFQANAVQVVKYAAK